MFIIHDYHSYVSEVGHILNTITFFELTTLYFLKGIVAENLWLSDGTQIIFLALN